MSAELYFDILPESDHATQAAQMNREHRAARIDRTLAAIEFRHRDPVLSSLQRELSREISVLESLKSLYDDPDRLTHCHYIHLASVIDEYVERVERAQLRVNQRAAVIGGWE